MKILVLIVSLFILSCCSSDKTNEVSKQQIDHVQSKDVVENDMQDTISNKEQQTNTNNNQYKDTSFAVETTTDDNTSSLNDSASGSEVPQYLQENTQTENKTSNSSDMIEVKEQNTSNDKPKNNIVDDSVVIDESELTNNIENKSELANTGNETTNNNEKVSEVTNDIDDIEDDFEAVDEVENDFDVDNSKPVEPDDSSNLEEETNKNMGNSVSQEDNIENLPYDTPLVKWNKKYALLLNENVKSGSVQGISTTLVDYQKLSTLPLLEELKEQLAVLNFSEEDKKTQLAMWINAYNFLTVYRVSKNLPLQAFNDLQQGSKNVWQQPAGIISGKSYTLDEIEHQVIRKQFTEPRIHFALVCAAVGCPDLRNEPFDAENLDSQLQQQLSIYLKNNKKGMRVENNKLYLSQIFSWFKDDFSGNAQNWLQQQGFLKRKYQEEYIHYNWSLNNNLFDDSYIKSFKLNDEKSLLSIVTHKAGVAASLAHDHMIYATSFFTKLSANPNFAKSVQFSTTIPTKKLYNDLYSLQEMWYPRLKKLQIQTSAFSKVSDSDRNKIRDNMLSSYQLDADNFPNIAAKLHQTILKENTLGEVQFPFLATVSVTIKGKTVTSDIPANVYFEENILRIEAVAKFKFTQFGITPYSAFLGAIKNSDDFYLYVNVRSE